MLSKDEYEREMSETYCVRKITKVQVFQISSELTDIRKIISVTRPTPRMKLLSLLADKMLYLIMEVYFNECE